MSSYKFPSSRVSGPALKETILCGVLQLLAFLAVWLRLWARRMKRKRLEFNDYVILVAWFFCASLLGTAIASTVWSGKGFHTQDIDPVYRSRVFVAFTAGQPLWGAANTAVKFSILHLYLTIFQDERFRRVCYGIMVVSLCYFLSVLLETFLICKPIQYNWDKTIHGTCDSRAQETYLAAGIVNLIIDVFIVAMPMPMLFQLRIPTGKKIGLIAMFGLGGVICIVSLLRVFYISRMDLHDFSYSYADLGMWSIVEPQLGVVNACLPVMRPLLHQAMQYKAFRRFFPSWAGSANRFSSGVQVPNGTDSLILHNTMDKLYPLDSVHLAGTSGSGVNLERVRSGYVN